MAAILWPPPTPLLQQLSILPGPDMEQRVMACVDDGTIQHLEIGPCLELRLDTNTNTNKVSVKVAREDQGCW